MITAYPMAGKPKSLQICRAFVEGCGGQVITDARDERQGPVFFYGIDKFNAHIWEQCRAGERDWWYADNSYIDATRQDYFRITRNGLQHSGEGKTTGERWRQLEIDIKPWRERGDHLVICPQSEHFMRIVCGVADDWLTSAKQELLKFSLRPHRVRHWSPDKGKLAATLWQDLDGAHALVTHSSAAAITAILNGVPALVTGESAARPVAGTLAQIEEPPMPSDDARLHWAGVLADQQFTLREMSEGTAWRMLEAQ